jgi:hypothetical protein
LAAPSSDFEMEPSIKRHCGALMLDIRRDHVTARLRWASTSFLLFPSPVILTDETSDFIGHSKEFLPLLAIECNRKASESSAGLSTRSPRRRFLCPCFRNQFDRREFCGSRRQAVSESAGDWADAAARTRIRPTPKVNVLRKFILVLDYAHFIGSASK